MSWFAKQIQILLFFLETALKAEFQELRLISSSKEIKPILDFQEIDSVPRIGNAWQYSDLDVVLYSENSEVTYE